ncbi:flagellar basal body L-ring protein FlgH [Aliikangiella coralliicola]|uniref:Flagellar L-ring protein n=1 Tax=Aliikangiella coralliicola TaxID=2592383 RepID=A0A545U5X1_9GAMM|nr:flagellar basal body L-ring protein FlgH [Aliikangiella coralliicola]TQV84867.1 flagellar basal body L-ring protein FlgH [Aliikangiella coralliicola]
MNFNRTLLIIFTGSAFLLSGCKTIYQNASMDDPNWAPAFPEVTDTSQSNPGAIFNPASAQMLFQDKKAHRIGDIITIVLSERTNATKTADTELGKDTTLSMGAPTLLGNANVNVGGGTSNLGVSYTGANSFKAETDSEQSNQLQGTITVTIHQVYPNGNLAIKGEKWISLNQGSEFIRVAGIIRPEDIDKDNQITSTRIANARISYGGTGPLAEANEEGWLSRFFNSGWWPF